jgi:outer membrane protein assembly factor BamB
LALCGGTGSEKPLPGPIPLALQAAPIQASWEDREIDFWSKAGVDGFLLRELGVPPPKGSPPPDDEAIRTLIGRFRKAGIENNFTQLSLPTRQSLYSEAEAAAQFVEKAKKAAVRAHEAGAIGIALDTQPASPVHTYLWTGHGEPSPSRESLRAASRSFGRALGESLAQGGADGSTLLVLADTLDEAGPLWFPFFDGLTLGANAGSARIHLLIRVSGDALSLRRLRRVSEEMLRLRLSPEALRVWESSGAIDLGLPLTDFDASPDSVAGVAPSGGAESMRLALVSGQLNADTFVLNTSAIPAGWKSPVSESKDGETPATPISFATPLDGYTRAGNLKVVGETADVLRNADGAAAVLLRGFPGRVSIPAQRTPILITDLRTGAVSKHPAESAPVELDPTDTPTLVGGLPVRDWVTPAGLWMHAEYPPVGQDRVAHVAYGWVNRTGVSFNGVIETATPERYTVAPSGLPFTAADGESVSATGRISGALGGAPSFTARLVMAAPQGKPIVRDVPLDFPPALRWSAAMDGPVASAPAVADLDGDGLPEVYAASQSGDVASFGPKGELRWRWESNAPVSVPPLVFRHWSGTSHLAVLDDAGWLRCYKPDGVLRFEEEIGVPVTAVPPCTANLHGFPGQELVYALDGDALVALLSNGQELWKVKADSGITGLTSVRSDGKRDAVVALTESATCMAVNADGTIHWQTTLPEGAVSAPIVIEGNASTMQGVLAGLGNGTILNLAIADGTIQEEWQAPNRIVPRRIALADMTGDGVQELLVSDGTSLSCLVADMRVLWSLSVENDGTPQPIVTPRGTLVLLPTREHEVWAIDASGDVLWKDRRAVGAIASSPLPLALGDPPVCVYVSHDGFVQAIEIPY